jgi:hypothetical protein
MRKLVVAIAAAVIATASHGAGDDLLLTSQPLHTRSDEARSGKGNGKGEGCRRAPTPSALSILGWGQEVTKPKEMLKTATRSLGDLAGVFEFDGETGYFYLYRTQGSGSKIVDTIHIVSGRPRFEAADVVVKWNSSEEKVGLLIKGGLWAICAFDGTRQQGMHCPRMDESTLRWLCQTELSSDHDVERAVAASQFSTWAMA